MRPPPPCRLRSQCPHHPAAKPGGIVSALRVSRRDEGESARDLCLSLEPGQNKKQGEGIGPQQTAVLAFGKLVAWKLIQSGSLQETFAAPALESYGIKLDVTGWAVGRRREKIKMTS